MAATQVLIAGAGPTGLVLALLLTRLGVRVRIIDKAAEPGTTSRALVVHARTLEFYRQIGLADAVLERGEEFVAANLWVRGTRVARAPFGDFGKGLSPYPYMVIFPQDEHERLLIERLAELGVEVERPTALLGVEDGGDRVRARVRRAGGAEESCEADYLAGCDGARSAVREALQVGFPGGTYAHLFYVADIEAHGAVTDGELHAALDDADFLAVFPMKGAGRVRLIGTVREQRGPGDAPLSWDDVSQHVVERMRVAVSRVNWFSTYHVHHRVANRFRAGRVFLLGDAAHIHSPVGGQGMNTGIGDAVNVAWKMAQVLEARADGRLLDSYEPERMAFARRLVSTTDRAFTVVTSSGPIARVVRLRVVPHLIPALFEMVAARRLMFRTVSQIAVNYRASDLSVGRAGSVHGGDRLPWVAPGGTAGRKTDNFTPLSALDWQVHIYGEAAEAMSRLCAERGLPLHLFPWRPASGKAGLMRNASYLVRPDGHVALADPDASPASLARYLDARALRAAPERNAAPASTRA
jgi:2-polyprenyl-6-methoxyphenol hydroxylase-like FAD-dependent oxidoreductase